MIFFIGDTDECSIIENLCFRLRVIDRFTGDTSILQRGCAPPGVNLCKQIPFNEWQVNIFDGIEGGINRILCMNTNSRTYSVQFVDYLTIMRLPLNPPSSTTAQWITVTEATCVTAVLPIHRRLLIACQPVSA